jgi:predicted RNA-binding Zn ribbon-like protein
MAPTRTLYHPDGQVFEFDAGALCLELLVTGGEGERARFELLHRPADFARWAVAGRLGLNQHGVEPAEIRVSAADLRKLKALREAVWSAAMAVGRGRHPEAADFATINELAAGPSLTPQIDPHTGGATWRRPITARQLLTAFARDAVTTFTRPVVDRLGKCANPVCGLHFLDTSRPGLRRWCSMERCGNRHKVSQYRQRENDGQASRS